MGLLDGDTIRVRTASKGYPIHLCASPAATVFSDILARFKNKKIAVITDTHLAAAYQSAIHEAFSKAGREMDLLVIPAGERSKTRRVKEHIEDALLERKYDRACLLIALGGGVVGDLAGFTAATYLRGVSFVQVPTSLLAMVDSSVGGKTGVDTPHGKNLVGAFWQPEAVYLSLDFLKTLPPAEFLQGFGEVLKYGFIMSPALDRRLAKERERILGGNPLALLPVIRDCLRIKRDVVGRDERETGGLRRTLNFGHTAGHAVEMLSHYRLSHGLCVSIGMAIEADVSVRQGLLPARDRDEIKTRLVTYGLPVTVPRAMGFPELYAAMLSDKKSSAEGVKMTLLSRLGRCAKGPVGDYAIPVSKKILSEAFKGARA